MTRAALAIALALLPAAAFPFGKKEQPAEPPAAVPPAGALPGQTVELTGVVRLVGNEPFPELVVSGGGEGEGDWYIEGAGRALLRPYDHRTVTVRGVAEFREMILADGRRLGTRRLLRDVVLVSGP